MLARSFVSVSIILLVSGSAFAKKATAEGANVATTQRPARKPVNRRVWPLRLRTVALLKKRLKHRRLLRKKRRRAYRPPLVRRRSVGWGRGERLTFKVRLGSISIGRSAISVGGTRKKKGTKRRLIKLRALGETLPLLQLLYRMREELVTVADLEAGLFPSRTVSVRQKGKQRREVITQHGVTTKQSITKQSIERPAPRARKRRRRFSRRPFDSLTALFHLRSVDLATNKTIDLTLLAGTALHRVQLKVKGVEEIVTVLGPRRCHRLHGWATRIDDSGRPLKNKRRRRVLMWLTADRAQIPVRVSGDTDLGYVTAELSSYQPAGRPLAVSVAVRP